MNGTQGSARVKEQRRVMDQASRQRRARKKLESLEQDNFHDDPHADLVRLYTILQGRRKVEKYGGGQAHIYEELEKKLESPG